MFSDGGRRRGQDQRGKQALRVWKGKMGFPEINRFDEQAFVAALCGGKRGGGIVPLKASDKRSQHAGGGCFTCFWFRLNLSESVSVKERPEEAKHRFGGVKASYGTVFGGAQKRGESISLGGPEKLPVEEQEAVEPA